MSWATTGKYVLDTVTSRAYWEYVLFSLSGFRSALTVFGGVYLVAEST